MYSQVALKEYVGSKKINRFFIANRFNYSNFIDTTLKLDEKFDNTFLYLYSVTYLLRVTVSTLGLSHERKILP